jgi:hypothetical protein
VNELVTALAGGAIGSLITAGVRYAAIPSEVRQHDRQIAEIDWDLDRFAADEYARLRNVVLPEVLPPTGVTHLVLEPNARTPPERAKQYTNAIAYSIQLYRDHEHGRITQYVDIVASEKWAHKVWRLIESRPIPSLKTPLSAARFLDRWWTLRVSSSERAHLPDPRQRTIAAAEKSLDKECAELEQEAGPAARP